MTDYIDPADLFDDSDLDEPDYYCEHGRFVGNPYGADYMCHFCEGGYTREEYLYHCARTVEERAEEQRIELHGDYFGNMVGYVLRLTHGIEDRDAAHAVIDAAWPIERIKAHNAVLSARVFTSARR